MANPTTNFGWVMPTSSSLVTNLPADFNTFGQAVDTSMSELLGGTTGQVLSKTSNTNMDFTWVTPTDQTPLTTKGDLFTFSTVDARLAVGTNGQTLVADSTASTGLKWATPSSGALTLISTTTFSAVASQSFNSVFSATYTNYLILGTGIFLSTGTSDFRMRLRVSGTDNTNAAYMIAGFKSTNVSLTNAVLQTTYFALGDIGTRDEQSLDMTLLRPFVAKDTTGNFNWNGTNYNNPNNTGGGNAHGVTTSYDGFTLYAGAGNISGTISIYGMSI